MSRHKLKHQKVTVIGAGVLGSLVALSLADAGVTVQIVDENLPGSGASGTTIPWVNASGKRPRAYFDLCRDSMAAWEDLAHRLGGDWYRKTGNLHWTDDPVWLDTLKQRAEEAKGWGYQSKWLSADQVHALEPSVDMSSAVGEALLYPHEAHIHVPSLMNHLRRETEALGVEWRIGQPVSDIETDKGKVSQLHLSDGPKLPVEQLVVCAGIRTNEVLELVGSKVPIVEHDPKGRVTSSEHKVYKTIHGLILETIDNPTGIQRILHGPGITIVPSDGGGLLLHSTAANEGVTLGQDIELDSDVVQGVFELACKAVPGIRTTQLKSATLGMRPIPIDSLPALGPLRDFDNLHVAVAHSAITAGPQLAATLVNNMLTGADVPADLNVQRFN